LYRRVEYSGSRSDRVHAFVRLIATGRKDYAERCLCRFLNGYRLESFTRGTRRGPNGCDGSTQRLVRPGHSGARRLALAMYQRGSNGSLDSNP